MSMKLYLVEDEKNLNILLKTYLQKSGYEVTSFLDGKTAVEKIKDVPDIWILDIMLPDILGYELVKIIKENDKNTPVIFMSARNEEFDKAAGLSLESDDYLAKPFLPKELIFKVKKLLETKNDKIKKDIS